MSALVLPCDPIAGESPPTRKLENFRRTGPGRSLGSRSKLRDREHQARLRLQRILRGEGAPAGLAPHRRAEGRCRSADGGNQKLTSENERTALLCASFFEKIPARSSDACRVLVAVSFHCRSFPFASA